MRTLKPPPHDMKYSELARDATHSSRRSCRYILGTMELSGGSLSTFLYRRCSVGKQPATSGVPSERKRKSKGQSKEDTRRCSKMREKKKSERTLLSLYQRALTIVAVINSEGGEWGEGRENEKVAGAVHKAPITSRLSSYGIE